MFTQEDAVLLNNLRELIKSVLEYVSHREKILSKNEGEVIISLSSPIGNTSEYTIRINSYLMNSSNLKQEWTSKSLKHALQMAINGVQYWNQFEKDVMPFNKPLSLNLIDEYL